MRIEIHYKKDEVKDWLNDLKEDGEDMTWAEDIALVYKRFEEDLYDIIIHGDDIKYARYIMHN